MTDQKKYSGKGWQLIRFNDVPEFVAAPVVVIGALALLFLFGLGISLIWSLVGRVWQSGTDTVPAASAALTAIAAVFGAVFLTWRTVVAHWQARANQAQAEISRESFYTTLFTKAVEQLGAVREIKKTVDIEKDGSKRFETQSATEPNVEVRVGAIYALERIAQDSLRDHWAIMEVLCAYVRENSPRDSTEFKLSAAIEYGVGDSESRFGQAKRTFEEWRQNLKGPRTDIQAAVTVIGRRAVERRDWEREQAKGRADRFYLDLRGANLRGVDFRGLWFERTFDGCQLELAEFWSSHLAGANFVRCELSGAKIWESDLKEAHLSRVNAVGAEFVRNDLTSVRMSFNNFTASLWNYTKLFEVYCLRSKFIGCSFHRVDADRARFNDCTFDHANFSMASLNGVELEGSAAQARFENASIYGANFSMVSALTESQISSVFEGDSETRLPDDLTRPSHWPTQKVEPKEADDRMNRNLSTLFEESNARREQYLQTRDRRSSPG